MELNSLIKTDVNKAVAAGAAGALALNLVHESVRQFFPNAPRVHKVAMQATDKFVMKPIGVRPGKNQLYWTTLAGDLLSNTLYYAAVVGIFENKDSKAVWRRSTGFGLIAGALTVVLPPLVNPKQQPTSNFKKTAGLTVAWYTIGALVAAGVYNSLNRKR